MKYDSRSKVVGYLGNCERARGNILIATYDGPGMTPPKTNKGSSSKTAPDTSTAKVSTPPAFDPPASPKTRLTFLEMSRVAMHCGASALMIVNVEDSLAPDFIYGPFLSEEEKEKEKEKKSNVDVNVNVNEDFNVDIPVVMISLTSGNILTTSGDDGTGANTANTVDPDPTGGLSSMPSRVRLYAGGDRPFFEDVSIDGPMVYLIHNLLDGGDGAVNSGGKGGGWGKGQ